MSYRDLFSEQARAYARYRPRYPAELFDFLAGLAPRRRRAVDLAAGSGQASVGLADAFDEVLAVEASAKQLGAALPCPKVAYRLARAEDTGLPDGYADLVTIAQALHWLDLDRLWPEVRRILVPGGAVAVWMYGLARVPASGGEEPAPSEVDRWIDVFYREVVGPYWAPERRRVDREYADLPFPFEAGSPERRGEEAGPPRELALDWTLPDLLGYFDSWSASRAYRRERGTDPVDEVRAALAAAWGDPERARTVRWPLVWRIGRT